MANSKYRVPKNEQRAYERLVARANTRIRANLEYIQQEAIETEQTRRSLLGMYADRSEWYNEKVTFHDRVIFNSKQEYEQYKRNVEKWGGVETGRKKGNRYEIETPEASVEGRKKGYYEAIIKSLTDSAITNNVPMENGKLPGDIAKKIKSLNVEQLAQFYDNDDAVADLEYLPYSEVDFNGVSSSQFVENVDLIVNSLKQVYPHANLKAYRRMLSDGIDADAALRRIFPKATKHQIVYYRYSGNIPEVYKPPRKRAKGKNKRK